MENFVEELNTAEEKGNVAFLEKNIYRWFYWYRTTRFHSYKEKKEKIALIEKETIIFYVSDKQIRNDHNYSNVTLFRF